MGYNYDRLFRIAEDMSYEMRKNPRVKDIVIETPNRLSMEDQMYIRYDKESIETRGCDVQAAHNTLREDGTARLIER